MTKHTLLLAALLAAGSAHAQPYLTGSLGASHLNGDCTGASSCNTGSTGFRLGGGVKLNEVVGLEANYINFGKFSAASGNTSVTLKPQALTFGAAAAVPFTTNWGLTARLGVARSRTRLDAASGAVSGADRQSTTKAYTGLGLYYALSPHARLEFSVDTTRVQYGDDKGNVRLASLGGSFSF